MWKILREAHCSQYGGQINFFILCPNVWKCIFGANLGFLENTSFKKLEKMFWSDSQKNHTFGNFERWILIKKKKIDLSQLKSVFGSIFDFSRKPLCSQHLQSQTSRLFSVYGWINFLTILKNQKNKVLRN